LAILVDEGRNNGWCEGLQCRNAISIHVPIIKLNWPLLYPSGINH
jgi:hypothetical protein